MMSVLMPVASQKRNTFVLRINLITADNFARTNEDYYQILSENYASFIFIDVLSFYTPIPSAAVALTK